MTITLSTEEIAKIAKQLICRHVNISGGNDYLLCSDCDLMWDYTKVTPLIMLKVYRHPITENYVKSHK